MDLGRFPHSRSKLLVVYGGLLVKLPQGTQRNGMLAAGALVEPDGRDYVKLPLRDIEKVQRFLILVRQQSEHVHLGMATLLLRLRLVSASHRQVFGQLKQMDESIA
jgi:hypothetical protein